MTTVNAPIPLAMDFGLACKAGRDFRYSLSVIPGLAQGIDILALAFAGALVALVANAFGGLDARAAIIQTALIAVTYGFLAVQSGFYSVDALMRPLAQLGGIIGALGKAALAFFVVAQALGVAETHPPVWTAAFAVAATACVITARLGASVALLALSRRGVIGSAIAVLGSGDHTRRFLRNYNNAAPYLSRIVGVFDVDATRIGGDAGGQPVLGGVETLLDLARRRKIDDVVIAMPWDGGMHLREIIEALKELPINLHLSSDMVGYDLNLDPTPGAVGNCPVFAVMRRPISGGNSVLKAIEDYVLTIVALIVIAPLLGLIALAIRLDSPGPVLFRQKRLGFNNKVFEIYKFRSMYHNPGAAEVGFTQQATRNDPRVTRVGRFIRATSLDELPQLFNVLDGTMSLVGPRPHALSHNEEYGRAIRGYFARHRVKPGITGLAQVNGLRGETSDITLMEARVRYDVKYADNWSLLLDFKILVMTVIVVLFQRSAY